jgi:predicted RNA-binding Zn-ribbon protein involved in translation (DUF1610 family)
MPTIREYLKQRNRVTNVIIWAGCGLTLVLLVFERHALTKAQINLWSWGGVATTAAVAILYSLSGRRFLCPQCGKRVLKAKRGPKFWETVERYNSAEGLAACPHCGASFDVPMPP